MPMISETDYQKLKKPARKRVVLRRLEKTEEGEQMAVLAWCRLHEGTYPELKLLFHIPNGGSRHIVEARKFTALGVKPGVPDLCWPIARRNFSCLWIEMKSQKGKVSPAQRHWADALMAEGSCVCVCHSAESAIHALRWYLGLE